MNAMQNYVRQDVSVLNITQLNLGAFRVPLPLRSDTEQRKRENYGVSNVIILLSAET